MAHFAQLDENNVVMQVIVADESFISKQPGRWVQTSYNTFSGEHKLGGTPLRKNFAAVGYTYDESKDAFIPIKPYDSWVLNENTCTWVPPKSTPSDGGVYYWDEETTTWIEKE